MAEITWIKLNTDMFENDKIRLIEKLPDADTILIIWVKLLAHAGKANAGGYIMLTENVPLSTEDLATLFNRPLNTVRLALETFKRYRMIEISDDDAIRIKNWDIYQNLESMEKVREQNRLRKQRQRAREKQLPEPLETPSQQDNDHENVKSRDSHATDIDKELDKDKEKDIKDSRRKLKFDDQHMELAQLLFSIMKVNNPNAKQPNFKSWANEFRLTMEMDNRSYQELDYLIRWSQKDSFWKTNILSPAKLRKQVDQLELIIKTKKTELAQARSPADFASKKLERERQAEDEIRRRYQTDDTGPGD
jgi:predicted phage replisome organizer